jgi:hypothetical protein
MKRSGRESVFVSVVKPRDVVLSIDPRGDALLSFHTTGNAVLSIILSMSALGEFEAMVDQARLVEAKTQSQH